MYKLCQGLSATPHPLYNFYYTHKTTKTIEYEKDAIPEILRHNSENKKLCLG